MLTTPAGTSAAAKIFASSSVLLGVISLGFTTIVQPVRSAGATFRARTYSGKFHGTIPPMTPMGCRSSSSISPGRSLGMTSPSIRRAHSAV